jgi:uncharacterized RDD family membrane protein YckC
VQLLAENSSRASLLFLRWLGTWVDLIVLAALILGPAFAVRATGETSYNYGVIVGLILAVLYFPVPEAIWGVSLGKLATGLRVVDKAGRPPGLWKAVIRTLLRLLEVNPFLLGGIPAGIAVLASRRKQRLGDMAAGTYVLSGREIREANEQAVEEVFS